MAMTFGPRRTGARSVGRERTRPMSEINVTPLVDVMLVLLVIFMITAPLLTTGVQVDLPQVSTAMIHGQDEPVAVTVDRQGKIFLGDRELTMDALLARLQAIAQNNPEVRIFVRGDQAIPYGSVMAVIASIQSAGLKKVALLTQPLDGVSPPSKQRAALTKPAR